MRITVLLCFILFISKSSSVRIFEGELIYHHSMKVDSIDFLNSEKYFDTLKVIYGNKNYIKIKNSTEYEKVIFIDSLKKEYVIYKDNLSKSKNLSMNEDNLNYGKLYNRENSHFGTIIALEKSDTVIKFRNKTYGLKKLFVERKYGYETYVFSENDSLKLTDNRNILRNMGEQIHPKEIALEIDNSIIYYYRLEAKNSNVLQEFSLVDIKNIKLNRTVFKLPEHRDAKGFKKENRKNGRFKFFELENQK
ncbi:hypothetical protein [Hyunsoonleella ulvae]|uniref:hypothetical protein n=1 Tax=Hyunsoonleella ulvae TaxID=2799948 RepID=UPI00193A63B5|nr:hypothetical protein [Hyunsoonleella ulvae]